MVSGLHATRYVPLDARQRTSRQKTRDDDGNIVSETVSDLHHYRYCTGEIPSVQFENLIRAIAIDEFQGVILYHQVIQGKY